MEGRRDEERQVEKELEMGVGVGSVNQDILHACMEFSSTELKKDEEGHAPLWKWQLSRAYWDLLIICYINHPSWTKVPKGGGGRGVLCYVGLGPRKTCVNGSACSKF